MATHVIWIDPKIDNAENSGYTDELKKKYSSYLKTYKNIDEAYLYI